MSCYGDVEEPMEFYQASVTVPRDKEVLLILSLKWSQLKPQKLKISLQKILQSWFNTRRIMLDCTVERTLRDGSVVVKVTPAPALCDLQELNGQTLTGKDGNAVTILSISLTPTILDSQILDGHYWYMSSIDKEEIKHIETEYKVQIKANAIEEFEAKREDGNPEGALSEFTNLVQSSLPNFEGSFIPLKFVDPDQWRSDAMKVIQENKSKLLLTLSCEAAQAQDEQSHPVGKDNEPQRKYSLETHKKPSYDCLVPVNIYWYMNHIYKEEMNRIIKENGVEMEANVEVKFKAKQKDGNPERALSEFTQLVKDSSSESQDSVIPVKFVDPEQWSDAMRVIQENKSKLLLTLSCEEVTLCGPSQSQDAFSAALNAMQKINASPKQNKPAPVMEGDQPLGTMTTTQHASPLPGFPNCGHIFICYNIPSGVQTNKHPNPGQPFYGTRRSAYLPDNTEGNEVVLLLKKAFKQKLIFTVGTSRTTGAQNQVIWSDVSHKTSMTGGPESYGYPDPNYLKRVKLELKAKGIQ